MRTQVRNRARTLGDTALRHSPAQAVFRRRTSRRLAVLAYHGVDDVDAFARHLDHVTRHLHPVSLDDVIAAARGSSSLPSGAVLVTFDDGHRSVLESAAPLLREYDVPAVAFVIAGLVGTRSPFWWTEVEAAYAAGGRVPGAPDGSAAALVGWLKTVPDGLRRESVEALRAAIRDVPVASGQLSPDDLRTLERAGVAVGHHTWSHPCLDRCDDDVLDHELRHAHDRLAAIIGHHPRAFAYPNGNHDARAERVLAELGYEAAFLFDHRLAAPAEVRSAPLRISRVRVGSTTSPDRFATIVSGLHPAVHRLRGGV